jgi:regulator of sigma E protease
MTGKIAEQGVWPLLQFAALLSLNLAVINFLPIPALDGGRFLFLAIEAIRRRKASLKLEAAIHRIGFIFLIGLVLLVTLRDLRQYGGGILNGIRNLF